MLGELVPCAGGPPIPLRKRKLLVGRQNSCDIPLAYGTVSSRHCELDLRDGYWFVRDLGSSNGTRVNGKPCQSEWLMPNDVLTVAKYRYTIAYTPPPGRPPPRKGEAEAASKPGSAPKGWGAAEAPAPRTVASGTRLGELVPCGGGDPIPLLKPTLVVGRNEGCDIVLRSGAVSGRHCQLEFAGGTWVVRDLGSRNGTRVDGERCQAKALPPGCVLTVANLRYRIAYTPPGAARPATKGPVFGQSLLEAAGLTRWQPPAEAVQDDDPPRPRYNLDDTD
jgi:adenylate cyclase